MKAEVLGICKADGCRFRLISERQWSYMSPEARPADVRPRRGGGLCQGHFRRQQRYGDANYVPPGKGRKVHVHACPVCGRATSNKHSRELDPSLKETTLMTQYRSGHCIRHGRDLEKVLVRSAEEVLEDWVLIRDTDTQDLELASARMGMTRSALYQALWRARRRGDPRGSLIPFAHDMRRAA